MIGELAGAKYRSPSMASFPSRGEIASLDGRRGTITLPAGFNPTRADGNTLSVGIGNIVDTVTINLIFWLWTASADPGSFLGKMGAGERYAWIFAKIGREYGIKVVVAILLTPAVYAIHGFVVRVMRIEPAAAEKRGK